MEESGPTERFLRKGDRWLVYAVAIMFAIVAYFWH